MSQAGNWVDWGQMYEGLSDGAGVHPGTIDDIAELNKAMSAGDGQPVFGQSTPGALQPLMPESLETTLKYLTYTEEEFKFWRDIYKTGAVNTAEEYNRLVRVGSGDSVFINEGDLPEEEDSTYSREVVLMKFMGTTRRVTHVASLVKTAGVANAIAAETRNGTLWLMRQLEQKLFFGDSRLIPQEFDGFKSLIEQGDGLIYDNRGDPLSEELLNGLTGAVRGAPNYGYIDKWYMSIGVKSDVANIIRARQRTMFGEKVVLGDVINEFQAQTGGRQKLLDDVFIREGELPEAAGVGKADKRPLVPVIGAAATPPNGASKFEAADAGTYFYRVVALNRFGRSVPVDSAGIAVADGDEVNFTITDGGQGTTAYIIYRSAKDAADASAAKEMVRIPRTGVATVFTDLNDDLPGTSVVFGFESHPDTMSYKQLAPFTRLPLATIDTSIRWMQVLYGSPVLYRPRHVVMVKNVGRDPNAPAVDLAFPGFE